jgi:hypothetical protein
MLDLSKLWQQSSGRKATATATRFGEARIFAGRAALAGLKIHGVADRFPRPPRPCPERSTCAQKIRFKALTSLRPMAPPP